MGVKALPPRESRPTRERRLGSDAVIVDGQRIPLRLLKDHGVTHAVVYVVVDSGWWGVVRKTVTACRGESDVPWSRTSRYKALRIDCMGCLVGLSRL